jgi:cytochrome P450
MAYPTIEWLLEPTFPAPPGLPRLDREISAVPTLDAPRVQYPSGTWRVGTHAEADAALDDEDTDSQRFAKSDSEAPTVRPGALLAVKKR